MLLTELFYFRWQFFNATQMDVFSCLFFSAIAICNYREMAHDCQTTQYTCHAKALQIHLSFFHFSSPSKKQRFVWTTKHQKNLYPFFKCLNIGKLLCGEKSLAITLVSFEKKICRQSRRAKIYENIASFTLR